MLLAIFSFCASCTESASSEAVPNDGRGCVLGSQTDGAADVWLLPSPTEARKLETAFKRRQQGTINLLLAKYDHVKVRAGTACVRIDSADGLVKVRSTKDSIEGWVPSHQVEASKD